MSLTPGWYQDSTGVMRWWDGQKWTSQTQPSAAQPGSSGPGPVPPPVLGPPPVYGSGQPPQPYMSQPGAQPPGWGQFPSHAPMSGDPALHGPAMQMVGAGAPPPLRRKSGKGWIIAVAVTAVVVTAGGIGASALGIFARSVVAWGAIVANDSYGFTETQHVSYDAALEIPTGGVSASAFSLYADEAMRTEVEIDTETDEDILRISPANLHGDAECIEDRGDWVCDDSVQQIANDGELWGAGAQFWLVRTEDESGATLSVPVVTEVVVDRPDALETPWFQVTANEEGMAEVTWTSSPGADEYRIVISARTADTVQNTVVASSTGSSWTASIVEGEGEMLQNVELRFNENFDEDNAGAVNENEDTIYGICVVATDGEHFSGCDYKDAADEIGDLPYRHAMNMQLEKHHEIVGEPTFENIPTRVYYVGLDGYMRSAPGHVSEDGINEDGTEIKIYGIGTHIGYMIDGHGFDEEAALTFNTRSATDGGNTGNGESDSEFTDEDIDGGDSDDVEVEYDVRGSSELVKFIARHLINHTETIDASRFLDQPGAPSLDDAFDEAAIQNPYSLWIASTSTSANGTIRVEYAQTAEEHADIIARSQAKVEEIVAATITEGMSDAEIVTALNNWIIANAYYDMAALDSIVQTSDVVGYEYSQTPEGILLRGYGVCASYADAFLLLANEAGVETVEIFGVIEDGQGGHAWNKSLVDGHWVAVDPTWNDGEGQGPDNRYLMIQDSEFVDQAARHEDDYWMVDAYIDSYATS